MVAFQVKKNQTRPSWAECKGTRFMLPVFLCAGCVAFLAWIYLALGHGSFWSLLLPEDSLLPAQLPTVDIIIPARDEAGALPYTLPSLLMQDYQGEWRVIVVDDHSIDGTAEVAHTVAALVKTDRLTVIQAPDLPRGWSGKVAAMHAAASQSKADLLLFTDADIRHAPGSLRHLVSRAEARKIDLVSRMAKLNCVSFAEKLLIPPFIFFFAKLYPFRRANNPASRIAAAAGGAMLIRRSMLDKIGGLTSIGSALIDDCGLAKMVKQAGGRTELTLTRVYPIASFSLAFSRNSHRPCHSLFGAPLALFTGPEP
jgi:hopene-associated glycosyltransferase HpnB